MPELEAASSSLVAELKNNRADYLEARLEEARASHITYRGKNLESIGRSFSTGGNVRALTTVLNR